MKNSYHIKKILIGCGLIALSACQTPPISSSPAATRPVVVIAAPPLVNPQAQTSPSGSLPDIAQGALKSSPLPPLPKKNNTILTPPLPPQPVVAKNRRDGRNIPVVHSLIEQAKQQLRQNNIDNAEQSLTQAQRLAPENPAIYAYFTEIALLRKNGAQAEAMARRGVLLATSNAQRKAFWQLVLQAAELQKNLLGINEARKQIGQLP